MKRPRRRSELRQSLRRLSKAERRKNRQHTKKSQKRRILFGGIGGFVLAIVVFYMQYMPKISLVQQMQFSYPGSISFEIKNEQFYSLSNVRAFCRPLDIQRPYSYSDSTSRLLLYYPDTLLATKSSLPDTLIGMRSLIPHVSKIEGYQASRAHFILSDFITDKFGTALNERDLVHLHIYLIYEAPLIYWWSNVKKYDFECTPDGRQILHCFQI